MQGESENGLENVFSPFLRLSFSLERERERFCVSERVDDNDLVLLLGKQLKVCYKKYV